MPWRAAFELAWESHRAGSPGVGAVIVNAQGRLVATGRSRRGEATEELNQLSGSRMAHAEINALAGLRVDQHAGLTLLVTLEPCLLCAAAVAISHVPRVVFAGRDPVWSYLRSLPSFDRRLADRWPRVEGPMGGRLGAWASLVPLIERIERDPSGARVDEFEREAPAVLALARELVMDSTAPQLRSLDLDQALDEVWRRLRV
jgi:tRNA(Arg) A34 adenosine deaminase TadA